VVRDRDRDRVGAASGASIYPFVPGVAAAGWLGLRPLPDWELPAEVLQKL